jgi:hypothetical protein
MTENMKSFFDELQEALKKHNISFWIHEEEDCYEIVFNEKDSYLPFFLKLNPHSTFDSNAIGVAKNSALYFKANNAFIC